MYRVTQQVSDLGWVDFVLPNSAWTDERYAEWVEQLGKMNKTS